MSNLLTLEDISLAFGLDPLLDHVKFQIVTGERVCLIGRNGAGKSSLLKIIEGSLQPDGGQVWRRPQLRISRLEQSLPASPTQSVYEFVAEGLAEAGKLLASYHLLAAGLTEHSTQSDLNKLEKLTQKIDAVNAWQIDQDIKTILMRLELDPDVKISDLSGGWQRRAALAKALVSAPDLLLLDEPTNHLDVDAIQWLEEFLLTTQVALIFITHDRALLQCLATRIIELDRGQLSSWDCRYQQFLERKAAVLQAEAKENADFDKKLAQEEKWIRQGIKARRTRNEGRVRALKEMRRERGRRREVEGKVSFNLSDAVQSGKLVVEANNITQIYDGKTVIKDFSIRIMRGDRIGLIGPNGAGKSTLLNILLGNTLCQQGDVRIGTKLEIAYFDQRREMLSHDKSVAENVAEGRDVVVIDGKEKHVISYLSDFLFSPERSRASVKVLSGGEANRLLLARLFARPSNLLVLDEPTNDLDIETLELLEELISEYKGTLLVVSHDREFLDNVVTSTLVFDGKGRIDEYVGGYQDYLKQRPSNVVEEPTKKVALTEKPVSKTTKKLSYKEQVELNELPARIEQLEAAIQLQESLVQDANFYNQPPDMVAQEMDKLTGLNAELDTAYQRWNELESKHT